MSSGARRWLVLCLAALLLPALVGIGALFVLRQGIVAKYDQCVVSLSDKQRRTAGLELVVDALKRVPELQAATWNLNAPYKAGAINLLVPTDADAAWHERCGLPLAPADCLAAASEKIVICNKVVGAQFVNPLLTSGIARAEVLRARMFLAMAFLGHELGHLRAGAPPSVRHLYPTNRVDGLACTHADQSAPTEERIADEIGVKFACQATQANPDDRIGADADSAVRTLSYLRERLDEDYFAFDDTCRGDADYPSMSRRKSNFAKVYASCLFPGRDLPYASVANDQDVAFAKLETWLRERQRGGFVGSARYGADAQYVYEVAPTEAMTSFLAFDSSGATSEVSWTTVGEKSVRHEVVASWERAGRVLGVQTGRDGGSQFLASFAAPDGQYDIRNTSVRCGAAGASCQVKQESRRIGSGVEVQTTTGHAVVEVVGKRLRSFESFSDFVAKPPVLDTAVDFDLNGGTLLLDGTASRLLVARRPPDSGELASGFHRIGVVAPTGARWSTFASLGRNTSPLGAVGLFGNSAALAFFPVAYQLGGNLQLWICPVDLFNAAPPQKPKASCDIYDPPKELQYDVDLATNDLSALGTQFVAADQCEGLIVLRRDGWLWMLDPSRRLQDAVPAGGLVSCASDRATATVYRMRRIDRVALQFRTTEPRQYVVSVIAR